MSKKFGIGSLVVTWPEYENGSVPPHTRPEGTVGSVTRLTGGVFATADDVWYWAPGTEPGGRYKAAELTLGSRFSYPGELCYAYFQGYSAEGTPTYATMGGPTKEMPTFATRPAHGTPPAAVRLAPGNNKYAPGDAVMGTHSTAFGPVRAVYWTGSDYHYTVGRTDMLVAESRLKPQDLAPTVHDVEIPKLVLTDATTKGLIDATAKPPHVPPPPKAVPDGWQFMATPAERDIPRVLRELGYAGYNYGELATKTGHPTTKDGYERVGLLHQSLVERAAAVGIDQPEDYDLVCLTAGGGAWRTLKHKRTGEPMTFDGVKALADRILTKETTKRHHIVRGGRV